MSSLDILGRHGLSPLVATIVLVVFAVILGSLVMTVGKDYVENLPIEQPRSSTICLQKPQADPLKSLQVEFLQGRISRQEYLVRENAITP